MPDRRSMLKQIAVAGALASPPAMAFAAPKEPVIPEGEAIDPRTFGARGDGVTKDKAAIQKAIDLCAKRGGGIVHLSPGTYITGTILLKSNVNLHLSAGATLRGSGDPDDYSAPPEVQKPITWTVARHLILAYKESNIALTGMGTIDGFNSHFLEKSKQPGVPAPPDRQWASTSSTETNRIVRISPMIQIIDCTNVLVEGLTLQNAVGWTLRPIGCYHVVIRGVKVRNASNTQNTDGIDPTSCENVMISDCDIDTGDDALCIKSDNPWGENRICRNVTVTNCIIASACNGFKIGAEGVDRLENITFSNSIVFSREGRRDDQKTSSAIAIEMCDGGSIEGVTISNISIRNCRAPIFIRLQNRVGRTPTPMKSWLRSVSISDVQAFGAIVTSTITGIPDRSLEDITLRNIRIQTEEPGETAWAHNVVPEKEHAYPAETMFGRLPCFGIYCRHVDGLNLTDIDLVSNRNDPRPMLICDAVSDLSLSNLTGTPPVGGAESVLLRNVTGAAIAGHYPTAGNNIFVRVQGDMTAEISLFANDLSRAKTPLLVESNVPAGAVYVDSQPFNPRK